MNKILFLTNSHKEVFYNYFHFTLGYLVPISHYILENNLRDKELFLFQNTKHFEKHLLDTRLIKERNLNLNFFADRKAEKIRLKSVEILTRENYRLKENFHSYLDVVTNYLINNIPKQEPIELLLVKRVKENAKNRIVKNLDEFYEKAKKKFDVKLVELSEYSFMEQVAMFHNAKNIVAQHGAGLTNIIFCKKDVKIYEIDYLKRQHFQKIAEYLNLDNTLIPHKGIPEEAIIDVDKIIELIERRL